MIPILGVMIGAYIFTRMFDMMLKPAAERHPAHALLVVFGIGTIVVDVLCVLALLAGSASVPTP